MSSRIGRFYQKAVRAVNEPHRAGARKKLRAEDTAKRLGFKGCRTCQGCPGFGSGLNVHVQSVQGVPPDVASRVGLVRLVLIRWGMAGAKSHEELVTWQLCRQLKLDVYDLVKSGPVARDADLRDQLERAARNAPRAVAEGFGRYLPADFIRYLRYANGEVKEILDALQDGVDRRYFTAEDIQPLRRLAKRATRAIGGLIAYLRTSTPPNESPRRRRHRPDAPGAADPDQNARRSRAPEPAEPPEPNPRNPRHLRHPKND